MSADTSDLSLVRRVQRGDKGAFDALVLKYQHKVVKLVMRYVRNPAEAEDVAQEAFIKAYRALPQFRGDSAFYTWLYRIAINTAKNAVVSRERTVPTGQPMVAAISSYESPSSSRSTMAVRRSSGRASIAELTVPRISSVRTSPSGVSASFKRLCIS